MQITDSSEITQSLKPAINPNREKYNSDNSIREKNDNFWIYRIGKFAILLVLVVFMGSICFVVVKNILYDIKVQTLFVNQCANSLSAIIVSIATFFGLKNKG